MPQRAGKTLVAVCAAIMASAVALYLFEVVGPRTPGDNGLDYLREAAAAVRQYRARGINAAYEYLPANYILSNMTEQLEDGSEVLPLSGPSERLVVSCREGNRPFATYLADQHGMNNPKEAWGSEAIVGFVGDSYTYGACVDGRYHFVHAVRARHPGTLNFALGGHGPLAELASIREHVGESKPRVLFWVYSEENDVFTYWRFRPDLDIELDHPILARYLIEPAFRQGLFARQHLINRAVNANADAWLARISCGSICLARTRYLVGGALRRRTPRLDDTTRSEAFAAILRMAKIEVEAWGGRLVFVTMPSIVAACAGLDSPLRTIPMKIATELELDTIDLEGPLAERARAQGAQSIAGHFGCAGHLSEQGYAVVSEILLQYLDVLAGALKALPPYWQQTSLPGRRPRLVYAGPPYDRSRPLPQ